MLFESRNLDTRDKDPLIIWMRGEPGCSASAALFDEISPYHFKRNSLSEHGPADVVMNPLAWNNFTNVMILDSPVGTGFSYLRDTAS